MSFFDDTKNCGMALWIVGILMIISALVTIVMAFVDDDMNNDMAAWVLIGIGNLLCAFIFFGYGKKVRSGAISDKFGVVTEFVLVVAMTSILAGIFKIIGGAVGSFDGYLVSGVVAIIIGIILYFIYTKITNSSVGTFEKIIWIVLLILFVIGIIGCLLNLISGSGIVMVINLLVGILNLIIYIFMIVFLLDADVKKKFGM